MLIYRLLGTGLMPEWLIRAGIGNMLLQTLNKHKAPNVEEQQQRLMAFVRELKHLPIAIETDAANEQHYEVPAEFFGYVLGPYRKYSACWWDDTIQSLAQAELAMLEKYCQRAEVRDGQQILDLGCGWGSLTLYLAERYPTAHITALSNSQSQKAFILSEAKARQLNNVSVITANIAHYQTDCQFDRILSVEMLEHMKNYETLFAKISQWLKPDGLFFVHIFTHQRFAYHYEDSDGTDWLTRHFFSGGTMPSADLFHYFQNDLCLRHQWAVNGTHYQKTANAWIDNMKANRQAIMPILASVYGKNEAQKWWVYWMVFFMSCAELWGFRQGQEWTVTHYLFSR